MKKLLAVSDWLSVIDNYNILMAECRMLIAKMNFKKTKKIYIL
jgi:hypothetical protein